ncbi:MAG: hypothetical protein ACYDBB_20620 [Armatimonadota bacterium]
MIHQENSVRPTFFIASMMLACAIVNSLALIGKIFYLASSPDLGYWGLIYSVLDGLVIAGQFAVYGGIIKGASWARQAALTLFGLVFLLAASSSIHIGSMMTEEPGLELFLPLVDIGAKIVIGTRILASAILNGLMAYVANRDIV